MADHLDIDGAQEVLERYRSMLLEYERLTNGATPEDPDLTTSKAYEWLQRNEGQASQIVDAVHRSNIYWNSIDPRAIDIQLSIIHQALGEVETKEETSRIVRSETTIDINPDELHPWVWEPAKSLWSDGHYGKAIEEAANSINLKIQTKTGRNDISNTDLMKQALTLENPTRKSPVRLRVQPPDESETYKSRQQGAMHLAAGVFMLLRNIEAHQLEGTPREVAIEALAAISLLARVLDDAEVEELQSQ